MYVILDVETTQDPYTRKEEIIEFAAVHLDSKFEEVASLHLLIDPQKPLTNITKKVTGIRESDLRGRPTIQKVLPVILNFLSGKILIAHNANFDCRVLKYACEKCNLVADYSMFIDSLKIARHLFPGQSNSLTALKQRFNVNMKAHRAKEDVYSTLEVLMNFKDIFQQSDTNLFEELDKFKI